MKKTSKKGGGGGGGGVMPTFAYALHTKETC